MSDLIKRLRELHTAKRMAYPKMPEAGSAFGDAADALEQAQTEIDASKEVRICLVRHMGMLEQRIEQLEAALRNWLEIHDWCIEAGGAEGPLPQDVIQKFAEMQIPVVDNARTLIAGDAVTPKIRKTDLGWYCIEHGFTALKERCSQCDYTELRESVPGSDK